MTVNVKLKISWLCNFFYTIFFICMSPIANGQSFLVQVYNQNLHAEFGWGCPTNMFKPNTKSTMCAEVVSIPECPGGVYRNENGLCAGDAIPVCSVGKFAYLPSGNTGCVAQYAQLPYGSPSPAVFNRCMTEGLGENRPIPPTVVCEKLIVEKYGYGKITENLLNQCVASGEGNNRFYLPEDVCKKMALNIWGNVNPGNPLWIQVE